MQEAALLKAQCAARKQEHDSLQSDNNRLAAELQLARDEVARVRGLLDSQVLGLAVYGSAMCCIRGDIDVSLNPIVGSLACA